MTLAEFDKLFENQFVAFTVIENDNILFGDEDDEFEKFLMDYGDCVIDCIKPDVVHSVEFPNDIAFPHFYIYLL